MARTKASPSLTLAYVEGKLTVEPISTGTEHMPKHPLAEALGDFMQRIDDIAFAVRVMVPASGEILNTRIKKTKKSFDDAKIKIQTGSASEASHAGAAIIEASHEFDRLYRSKLPEVVARSLFVNLFSEYDYFFGLILKEFYNRRPDLLASLSKQISFEELMKFQNIDSVKESVLESELDSIRRESYVDQFNILQKKFGLPLTKFQDWALFVEAAQRRNLMVHCGGHVSEQYLQACDAVGYKFDERPKPTDRLEINKEYFERAANLVARVGFMLTHTLWRKVLPSEGEQANNELNDQVYRLLCAKRWKIAAELGTFSLAEPILNGTTDIQHRIRLCNTAIALKNLKRIVEMRNLLGALDWSASIRDFRLAVCVLEDKFDQAATLMIQIGRKGELVHEVAYHQWPLFAGFRESDEFQKAYEEVYGYPFYLKAEESTEEVRSRLEQGLESDKIPSVKVKRTARPKVKRVTKPKVLST